MNSFLKKTILIMACILLISACNTADSILVKRGIYFKLPLTQPEFHWVFLDRQLFFENTVLKLEVFKSKEMKIKKYSFNIIHNGKLSSDWTPIDEENHKDYNEIYFGFVSNKQYEFTTNDYAKLTLSTPIKLKGIGADITGNLPKGNYETYGHFSIYDEEIYDAGEDESVFIEKEELKPNWSLNITKDQGWSTNNTDANSPLPTKIKEDTTNSDDDLVPLFIPALSSVLTAAENRKGSPLTKAEVLSIRDNSQTIMTPKSMIESLAKKRDYKDIDPENCWNEWLILRQKRGEETEKNGGALVLKSPFDKTDMHKAEAKARKTLADFKAFIKKHDDINPLIKARIKDADTSTRMWLIVDKVNKDSFLASLFEVPSDFTEYKVGDSFLIKNKNVLDWMLNIKGKVYGAYTLREQQKNMTEQQKADMNEYMGIESYELF